MLVISLILLMGALTAYCASGRGRDPYIWFLVGSLFGLLGLALLFILPKVTPDEVKGEANPVVAAPAPQEEQIFQDKDWFYLDQQQKQQGPISFKALKKLWEQSAISNDSFIWSEGMQDWQKVSELPNFEEAIRSS